MTSSEDGAPPTINTTLPGLEVRKTRSPTRNESADTSATTLPERTLSPPTATSRSSTLASEISRSSSPSGRLSLSLARFTRSSTDSPLTNTSELNDDIRSLIVRAFSPPVAVCVSPETDELVKNKGIQGGFTRLLRPFGERIPGKVVVRDSTAASRAWEDFGVRFYSLGRLAQEATDTPRIGFLDDLEELLDQYVEHGPAQQGSNESTNDTSPYYQLFLARLLSSQQISQHEAFLHPVAAVIAISSDTPSPIETLRNLYQQTAQGSQALPPYANPEYLRYYVLVHDEDRDDFAKSSALFDQMKRHFGLHCHLLRLRSFAWSARDDEAEEVPHCEWLTATEDLGLSQQSSDSDAGETGNEAVYIPSSDTIAIRTFIRELVAQSIVPHMEQKIAIWNEQIASRRRGIQGRFMNLSKRWGGFGSRSTTTTNSGTGSSAYGNYDTVQDQYRYDTPEAQLRKMADYSMMLRDYKLAASTYEMLRADYSNDKAWKYLAGVNEMCCVATLLNPLTSGNSKLKIESFDQMLETASYSYLTRCNNPALTLRSILLAVELLKVRGPAASEMASKWGIRALQMNLVGSIGQVLIHERVISCLASRTGHGAIGWGTRKRKAAMWSIMAADEWMKLGRAEFAAPRLDEARDLYQELKNPSAVKGFEHMSEFMLQLQLAVKMKLQQGRPRVLSGASQLTETPSRMQQEAEDDLEEVAEQLEKLDTKPHRRNLSTLTGGINPLIEATGPLSPGFGRDRADGFSRNDDFE